MAGVNVSNARQDPAGMSARCVSDGGCRISYRFLARNLKAGALVESFAFANDQANRNQITVFDPKTKVARLRWNLEHTLRLDRLTWLQQGVERNFCPIHSRIESVVLGIEQIHIFRNQFSLRPSFGAAEDPQVDGVERLRVP